MSLSGLFGRRGSAPVARERLQILLEYERGLNQSDLVATLSRIASNTTPATRSAASRSMPALSNAWARVSRSVIGCTLLHKT